MLSARIRLSLAATGERHTNIAEPSANAATNIFILWTYEKETGWSRPG